MLVKDNKLDVEEFKNFFSNIDWIKLPRKLSQNHSEYFYIGKYEDDEKVIKITVRPSSRMKISESYKNRTLKGEIPPDNYKGELCNWGNTAEVLINSSFIANIKTVCKELPIETKQVLEW